MGHLHSSCSWSHLSSQKVIFGSSLLLSGPQEEQWDRNRSWGPSWCFSRGALGSENAAGPFPAFILWMRCGCQDFLLHMKPELQQMETLPSPEGLAFWEVLNAPLCVPCRAPIHCSQIFLIDSGAEEPGLETSQICFSTVYFCGLHLA